MLRDGKKFGEYLIKLSPMKTDKEIGLFETFRDTGKAVFYGNFISAVVQGILGGIGFAIFGIGSPIFWGAIMVFFSLIPLLGPFVIFIPASIYLFAIGDTTNAIIFLLYNILIVSSVDNIIKPRIISGKVDVHPLIMILAILGGLSAFGIMGIIYGPLIATLFLAVLKVYLEEPRINAD
jgi:predicted PurR-regulated permease PerM